MIGPRGSRRIIAFQQALLSHGLPCAQVLDYETLLADPTRLASAMADAPDALVKLESPGEAPALHHEFVLDGWKRSGAPGAAPHPAMHGELAHQHFWHAGFAGLLATLPPGMRYFNAPADLAQMADKLACQQQLANTGVPVPPLFGLVNGYDDMRGRMRAAGCHRVFVKARFGSSGAGVLAYACHPDGREVAYGSAELAQGGGHWRIFNSLRQRRYERHDEIARLIDIVTAQGAYLERWIPKPAVGTHGRHRFDVRMVVMDGQPRQRVARISTGALTNLHLGNARGRLGSWLDADAVETLECTAMAAAASFPRSRMVGFDLIVRGRRSWVLEANGFGDLLPGLRHAGHTTYDDQALMDAPAHA
ncbi:STM4014 family protein [Luteibacter yeojuensis]|uniref:ATP-grasp domain-containing protein n=1 Tax=Luteibacter yeojuensis TaxID=345309 RepID=A0A0F3KWL7_9GAMM|nr:hypothetical protein VI08_08130 [Luteibacter yeojuensis]